MKVRINDIVYVKGGAWSKCYNRSVGEERIRRFRTPGRLNTFEVLGVDCKLRVDGQTADTLVKDLESGAIWAVDECNLERHERVEVRFVNGGQDVTDELSQTSKRELLKARLEWE